MENFIVSARKYRPATFDTVVGQQSITNTLKNAIRNQHLAQAFLFCGPRGVGKTTCARILAKTINCMNISENIEPCDECESCVSFNESASFNIHELDAASNNSVEDIRNLVEQVRIPPQVGQFKVYIIDEVHMLSQAAFNAFLKTLEEPPAYAKFILATTEKHKIIPTILSRCQIFDFKRITVEDIAKHIAYVAEKEHVTFEPNALHIIAQKADGALRDALSIFDQIVSFSGNNITYQNVIENLNVLDYDYYFRIVDYLLNNDTTNTLLTTNEIIENGFDGQHFLIGLGEHLRNLLVCKDPATIKLLEVSDDFRERYAQQAQNCSIDFLLKSLEIMSSCDINYKSSNNKRLHLELAMMQLCTLSLNSGQAQKPAAAAPPVKKAVKENTPAPASPSATTTAATPPDTPPTATPPPPSTTDAATPPPSPQVEKPAKEEKSVEKGAEPETPATQTMYNGPGTISIKKAAEKEKEENNKVEEENEAFKPEAEFTQEQLAEAWKVYAIKVSGKLPSFASALTKYQPKLKDDHTIVFKTDNKIIAGDHINLNDLLGHLKKELNNYRIELKTEITKMEEGNKAYTDREKFDQMAKKNPSLLKLKNELDLEIEF